MAQPVWPLFQPTIPGKCLSIRARKEFASRDTVNARQYEHWRTDAPAPVSHTYNDMNPEASRNNFKSYASAQGYVVGSPGDLQANPYFDKYDVSSDPRNVIRELRNTVVEEKTDRGLKESQLLMKRQQVNRWVTEK